MEFIKLIAPSRISNAFVEPATVEISILLTAEVLLVKSPTSDVAAPFCRPTAVALLKTVNALMELNTIWPPTVELSPVVPAADKTSVPPDTVVVSP